MLQQRFKKKKAGKKEDDEKSSDEEDSDDEQKDPEIDYIKEEKEVAGLQLDIIARGMFRISRERAITACNDGLVRVNGRKAGKTEQVNEFDVVDLIRGWNQENPDLIDISRGEVIDIPDIASTMGRYKIKWHVWKFRTIENYKEEPYDGILLSKGESEKRSEEE